MKGVVKLEGAKLITNLLGLYTCVFCSPVIGYQKQSCLTTVHVSV
jgi:hypothetical protein